MSATVINATHAELVAQLVHRFDASQADNRQINQKLVLLRTELALERARCAEAHEECIELMAKVERLESDTPAPAREPILPTVLTKTYEGVGGTISVRGHAVPPTTHTPPTPTTRVDL